MKKFILFVICFTMLFGLGIRINAQNSDCIQVSIDPNSLPYPINALSLYGSLLGSRTQVRGISGQMVGYSCDPDGDPVTVMCNDGLPPGMTFQQTDPNGTYKISGKPTTSGTYYVHLTVTDSPKAPFTPESTSGTIVWYVLTPNSPPVLKGCGSSYIN